MFSEGGTGTAGPGHKEKLEGDGGAGVGGVGEMDSENR